MTAVGIASLMPEGPGYKVAPQMGRQSGDPDAGHEQHELADPDHDFAHNHHGKQVTPASAGFRDAGHQQENESAFRRRIISDECAGLLVDRLPVGKDKHLVRDAGDSRRSRFDGIAR
jgi:hypothetical protein